MFLPQLRLSTGSSLAKWKSFLPQSYSCVRFLCSCSYKSSLEVHTWISCSSSTWRKFSFLGAKTDFVRNNGNVSMHFLQRLSSSSDAPSSSQITDGEKQLKQTIKKCFPNATNIEVEDISGGCGSMYSIFIEAPDFRGLSTVKQHLLVNKALQQEIKSMHGIRIQTAASKEA